MAGKITARKKRELKATGLSTNAIVRMDGIVQAAPSGMAKSPPMSKDSLMNQPVEAWSRIDKKGHWGDSVLSVPSRRFKANYEKIDWDN